MNVRALVIINQIAIYPEEEESSVIFEKVMVTSNLSVLIQNRRKNSLNDWVI